MVFHLNSGFQGAVMGGFLANFAADLSECCCFPFRAGGDVKIHSNNSEISNLSARNGVHDEGIDLASETMNSFTRSSLPLYLLKFINL